MRAKGNCVIADQDSTISFVCLAACAAGDVVSAEAGRLLIARGRSHARPNSSAAKGQERKQVFRSMWLMVA